MNPIRKYELDSYNFLLYYDDYFSLKQLPLNRGIIVAARAAGVYLSHPWGGPFLLVKVEKLLEGDDRLPDQLDCTAHCLRQVVDFFQGYNDFPMCPRFDVHSTKTGPPGFLKGAFISAVQISCVGEVEIGRSPVFAAVHVPLNHPIYWEPDAGSLSHVSQNLGLGLRLWKDNVHEYSCDLAKFKDLDVPWSNTPAALLMMNTKVNSEGWGTTPHKWLADVGNVIAYRADKKPLSVQDVETAFLFLGNYVHLIMFEVRCRCDGRNWDKKLHVAPEVVCDSPETGIWLRQEAMKQVTWEKMTEWKQENNAKRLTKQ